MLFLRGNLLNWIPRRIEGTYYDEWWMRKVLIFTCNIVFIVYKSDHLFVPIQILNGMRFIQFPSVICSVAIFINTSIPFLKCLLNKFFISKISYYAINLGSLRNNNKAFRMYIIFWK